MSIVASFVCRKEVRQFHLEQKKDGFVRSPDWSLGKHSRMVTIREKHAEDNLAEAKERPVTKVRSQNTAFFRCSIGLAVFTGLIM